jgi:Leucine-rich repeat (LRR) protein
LTFLQLDENKDITSLPSSIENCREMLWMSMSYCSLSTISWKIEAWTKLTRLNLGGNKLTDLPDSLCTLVHLEELSVNDNLLTSLPVSFGNLKKLHTLRCERNKLIALPETLSQCNQLQWINAQNNLLDYLPTPLPPHLTHLYASNNCIESIDESFGPCYYLEWLFLDNNRITELPDSLKYCSALQGIFVENNKLTTIPKMTALPCLTTLVVSDNPLINFPKDILLYLPKLTWVYLPESLRYFIGMSVKPGVNVFYV